MPEPSGPLVEVLCGALVGLVNHDVAELPEAEQKALLGLRVVRDELEGPTPPPQDAAVRRAIGKHVQPGEHFNAETCDFLALWCGIGQARQTVAGDSWKEAVAAASATAFGTRGTTWDSVRRAVIDRRQGKAYGAIRQLAEVLAVAEEGPPSYRDWVWGPALQESSEGKHEGPRFVMLTAHAGTGLNGAIERFQQRRPDAVVIPLDPLLAFEGRRILEERMRGAEIPSDERELLREVYRLNRRALQWIWRRAFAIAMTSALEHLRDGRTVVLACSASIYHEGSGAISTAVNDAAMIEEFRDTRHETSQVRRALRDGLIITLIDDVFDCFARLREPLNLFDPSHAAFGFYPTRSAAMLAILEWRHRELMDAERTARLVGWRHLILPVKHSAETLARIIEGQPIVHFSHPSTTVRGAEGETEEQRAIIALGRALEAAGVALVDPIAIDERRFQLAFGRGSPPEGITGERLLPRWQAEALRAESAELLWEPPQSDDPEGVEQPFARRGEARSGGPHLPERLWGEDTGAALLQLWSEINRQHSWRLRLLINQADGGLVIYRPFRASDGLARSTVQQELTMHHQLRVHEASPRERQHARRITPSRPVVVVRTPADARRVALTNLVDVVSDNLIPRLNVDGAVSYPDLVAALAPWVDEASVELASAPGHGLSQQTTLRFLELFEPLASPPRAGEPPGRAALPPAELGSRLARILQGEEPSHLGNQLPLPDDAVVLDVPASEPPERLAADIVQALEASGGLVTKP